MKSINVDMQDYFVKIAPDFSVFDMAEKYFYDNNLPEGIFKDVFYYESIIAIAELVDTGIYRGMFLIYSDGDLEVVGASTDEYTVFPYNNNTQILIAIQDSSINITSTTTIEMMIGVAF